MQRTRQARQWGASDGACKGGNQSDQVRGQSGTCEASGGNWWGKRTGKQWGKPWGQVTGPTWGRQCGKWWDQVVGQMMGQVMGPAQSSGLTRPHATLPARRTASSFARSLACISSSPSSISMFVIDRIARMKRWASDDKETELPVKQRWGMPGTPS